jgi:hypothetical protein
MVATGALSIGARRADSSVLAATSASCASRPITPSNSATCSSLNFGAPTTKRSVTLRSVSVRRSAECDATAFSKSDIIEGVLIDPGRGVARGGRSAA